MKSKAIGHELAAEAGRDSMELHGANALTDDYPLERVWRDMQTTYAPAGTGEVQRIRLAQTLLHEQGHPGEETDRTQWSARLAHLTRHARADPAAAL
ncbi:acyl-CoA dehydrogenase family protein [Streptomyces sp. NPDC002755]